MLVMLADKHRRNAGLLSDPSGHMARGVPNQDALVRTPLWLMMMKAFPSGNGRWDPKQADGHHPMVTSLLDRRKVIIWPMKDGDGKRTLELGPILTMSCHPWYSNAKNKTNQIPCNKTLLFPVCLASKLHGNRPWPKWYPMVAGLDPRPSSKPHKDVLTCEPEHEVAPTQSMENLLVSPNFTFFTLPNLSSPFLQPSPACPTPPHSVIIIDDTPVGSPLPFLHPLLPRFLPQRSLPFPARTQPLPPLIPTMRLAWNSLTCDQH
ncbi:hypothetical protein O181_014812 [Austropuccinia psidii MF-1]|uniref:Uncharacterized protein n=1 Tax=Austropuccinia psidii MF-1 TaxID=1389203 RepID=A0A9Q3C2D1_9BASI|nr:hypothetical protein [Austropuccinia psidii MF-1]